MIKLPPLPRRIAALPKDERGYPVPWFVAWFRNDEPSSPNIEGATPDFRIVTHGRPMSAYHAERCWICGQSLGRHRVYAIGPMCVVNRVTSEPSSHRECAEFAVKACPFLTKPRMRRNEKGLPEETSTPGIMIERNPGVICLYETRFARPFRAGAGYLFRLGPPDRVDWWSMGRQATRSEVLASIDSGYPILLDLARHDGEEAIRELEKMRAEAEAHLPAEAA
jgi:hypothetical protein